MAAMGQSITVSFLRPISEGARGPRPRPPPRPHHLGLGAEVLDAEDRLCALAQMTIAVRPLPKSG